jgi:hypothetical protein
VGSILESLQLFFFLGGGGYKRQGPGGGIGRTREGKCAGVTTYLIGLLMADIGVPTTNELNTTLVQLLKIVYRGAQEGSQGLAKKGVVTVGKTVQAATYLKSA